MAGQDEDEVKRTQPPQILLPERKGGPGQEKPAKPLRPWWRKKRFIPLWLIAGWWLHQAWFYPIVFWYRVTATLEYQGEPVEVGGVVTCRRSRGFAGLLIAPYVRWLNVSFGPPNGVVKYPYLTNTVAFAERLPDGSGIILRHGMTCNSRMHERLTHGAGEIVIFDGLDYQLDDVAAAIRPYRPNKFPLIHWIDDVETPTQAEAYFADVYYADPRARFKFLGYKARRLAITEVPSLLDTMQVERERLVAELPWLGIEPSKHGESTFGPSFQGVYGYGFAQSEWSGHAETVEAVAAAEGSPLRHAPELWKHKFWHERLLNPSEVAVMRCHAGQKVALRSHCSLLDRVRFYAPTTKCRRLSDTLLIPGMVTMVPREVYGRALDQSEYCLGTEQPFLTRMGFFFFAQESGVLFRNFVFRLDAGSITNAWLDHY